MQYLNLKFKIIKTNNLNHCIMNKTDALKLAIAKAGNMSRLARSCGVTPQAVRAWIVRGQIPLSRVIDVKKATGLPLKKLRPDYFSDRT